MLTGVEFENYKILRDVKIPLGGLTVIVGPNGVGKTSVLEGVSQLFNIENKFIISKEERRELFSETSRFKKIIDTMNLDKKISKNKQNMKLLIKSSKDKIIISENNIQFYDTNNSKTSSLSDLITSNISWFISNNFPWLNQAIHLTLDPRQCGVPSPAAKGVPTLSEDGGGLPTLIAHIARRRDGAMERIEAAMARLIRGFRRIEVVETSIRRVEKETFTLNGQAFTQDRDREEPGFSLEVEFENVGRVPADQLSEGTRLVLAVVTLLHAPQRPRLLLLDDVDRALHPAAQVELIRLLRGLIRDTQANGTDSLQIITTAHSDTVLAECAPEEIVRLGYDNEGYACVVPVAGDPRWMTATQITERWFGLSGSTRDADLQRYALLAGDPERTDEEQAEIQRLATSLREQGARNLPEPEPRTATPA